MSTNIDAFIRLMNNPVKFRLFLLTKLPSAYFSGVRLVSIDAKTCRVKVPFKWFSQNPFRSTYFACLAMAAEMSTGALAMAHTYKKSPAVSMLVVSLTGSFLKKATGVSIFTCDEGHKIQVAIAESRLSGTSQQCSVVSTGINDIGEVIARFEITWSFKMRQDQA